MNRRKKHMDFQKKHMDHQKKIWISEKNISKGGSIHGIILSMQIIQI